MSKSVYPEYKQLNLPNIAADVLKRWQQEKTFERSVTNREGASSFTFYEGPPSANGMPGIHHVMARAIKDIFCRYQTLKGHQVKRKAGWDTHGLPIELSVEKTLGITKDDIGKKISIEDYNKACKQEVMKYKDKWDELTTLMGYWVDLDDPYITFENNYIETVWYLLKQLYDKKDANGNGFLYKGYTIQPYSWAAGTGLSSHELNQPGCYKSIKDTTVVAQFKVDESSKLKVQSLINTEISDDLFFLAWTTTPWTLPSNTALAVGKNINYVFVRTYNQYTFKPTTVILAKDLVGKYFKEEAVQNNLEAYKEGDKIIPYRILGEVKGADLAGLKYEQLLPYAQPSDGDAFRVVIGDFVSTEDGTGIVHIAPSFGADDFRVAKQNGIGTLTLVDKRGRFTEEVSDWAGLLVKQRDDTLKEGEKPTDVLIAIKLKEDGKAFKVEKYEHNYPHCWRTDQPVIYYPLDSWFIRTTAVKERMISLNKTINWKPESTGTGRFGNWLENLVDWNLSRSRYWGIPLPIWRTEDAREEICIGSVAQLKEEAEKAIKAGVADKAQLSTLDSALDLHRPYVDDIILVSPTGKAMRRELDLIDVWFDSGAMPYAQWHYPFENKDIFKNAFPADFIAEGVDQTRGWFFTLHAIAVMLFDNVAYKNVVSNGLVLDKNGNKMSKRLGNAVDPFETLAKYGPDATRWYMVSNAQPWDNLKFNLDGITEVQRKFFGTLYNTYGFFAIYANIDNFQIDRKNLVPVEKLQELDQWIIACLHNLIKEVDAAYADYDPTAAARAIESFVDEHLSNWYVRLSRRRFWKGEMTLDKKAAYETLYQCLETIAQLMSPVAPFFADWLYGNLTSTARKNQTALPDSVHLTNWPTSDKGLVNAELMESMQLAQDISSMVLALRKKVDIRVRQPLKKILLPVLDQDFQKKVDKVKDLIMAEVNVKEIAYVTDTAGMLTKKVKPNFKTLGKRAGALMKDLTTAITGMNQEEIRVLEANNNFQFTHFNPPFSISLEDVEVLSEDIPGWQVMNNGKLTVALDITITENLRDEGLARELVNRVQNLRKDAGFDVTDHIRLHVQRHNILERAVNNNLSYICGEVLASELKMVDSMENPAAVAVELDENLQTFIHIERN